LSFDAASGTLSIAAGRYYVDGILIENENACSYAAQPDYVPPSNDPLLAELKAQSGKTWWLYLDVWERHITYIEDDSIREKALNGPDTCTRAKVVWQVKALPPDSFTNPDTINTINCAKPLTNLDAVSPAWMAARVDPGFQPANACEIAPDAKYRGVENQLYRVEIHTPGAAGVATFKWSRDNGSVASPWLGFDGKDLHVMHARGFAGGDWVELSDDTLDLQGLPGTLVQIVNVQADKLTVDPNMTGSVAWGSQLVNPKVRRWNQKDSGSTSLSSGAIMVAEAPADGHNWLDLEDGIQIEFEVGGQYRTGDYWLIPARVATGQIEWSPAVDSSGKPQIGTDGNPVSAAIPPHGIEHHYAPLGFLSLSGNKMDPRMCGCTFHPGSGCFNVDQVAGGLPRPNGADGFPPKQRAKP
jgi:hypothetical protein